MAHKPVLHLAGGECLLILQWFPVDVVFVYILERSLITPVEGDLVVHSRIDINVEQLFEFLVLMTSQSGLKHEDPHCERNYYTSRHRR